MPATRRDKKRMELEIEDICDRMQDQLSHRKISVFYLLLDSLLILNMSLEHSFQEENYIKEY